MGLDLTGLRPGLEDLLLVDECELWRDVEGALDDVTDPVTGSVTGPVPDSTLVDTGPCKLKLVKRLPVAAPEGGQPTVVTSYELKRPSAAPEAQSGDRVKVTASVHDSALVGKWLRVSEGTHGSFSIFRLSMCEMRERADDRP